MYIKKKNPHGGDIYSHDVLLDLSSNMNPAGMPEMVKKAIQDSVDCCQKYPDPYCRELRRSISDREGIPEEYIICGNGAAELIYSYAFSLPKDHPALIISPTFSEYQDALEAADIEVSHYVLKEEDGFRLTADILDKDLSGYCAVFICTPNNPTGLTVEPELIKKLAGCGTYLFIDMCFLDMTDIPDRYDIPALLNDYPNVIVLKAFTKSYSMAGLRLGYAMCSDYGMLEAMSAKTQCWNVSAIAQQAGIAAYECDDWLKKSVKAVSEERKRLIEELGDLGIDVCPGEANYLLLRTDIDLYDEMLKRRILVRDCSNYVGLDKGYYRVAVRTPEENNVFLRAVGEVIR